LELFETGGDTLSVSVEVENRKGVDVRVSGSSEKPDNGNAIRCFEVYEFRSRKRLYCSPLSALCVVTGENQRILYPIEQARYSKIEEYEETG